LLVRFAHYFAKGEKSPKENSPLATLGGFKTKKLGEEGRDSKLAFINERLKTAIGLEARSVISSTSSYSFVILAYC